MVFMVMVLFCAVDRVNPVFRPCPGEIVRTVDFPDNAVIVTWIDPTADDNSRGTVTVAQSGGPSSGTSFAVGTTTPITYRATDPSGNVATCSFNVRIVRQGKIIWKCVFNVEFWYMQASFYSGCKSRIVQWAQVWDSGSSWCEVSRSKVKI